MSVSVCLQVVRSAGNFRLMKTNTNRTAMNVRAEMARHGCSQSALAAAIGISQTALHRRLSAHTSFTVDQIVAIAKYLNVAIVDLIDTTEDETPLPLHSRKAAS